MGLAWSSVLGLAIAAPWLQSGFIFATDWPGPRVFRVPPQIGSSWPLKTGLAAVAALVGGEATGKLFVLVILVGAGLAAYRALPAGGSLPRAAAAAIYVFNPFVYDRLEYGQLFLLAGYAALPLLAWGLRALLLRPTPSRILLTGACLTMLGIIDLHLLLPAGLLTAAGLAAFLVGSEGMSRRVDALKGVAAAAVVALIASAWWLVPFATRSSGEAQLVGRITGADVIAFRTVADRRLGVWPNVLGLYGFFGERTGYYASMKSFVPFWGPVLALLVGFAALGVFGVLRGRIIFPGAIPWTLALTFAGLAAVVLSVGAADPRVAPLVGWLNRELPLFKGMRESGKWTVLVALAYSQLFPLGLLTARSLAAAWAPPRAVSVISGLLAIVAVALPIYYGNGLLLGDRGQIQPSQYPSGWYAVDRVLRSDPHPGRTVFLPWIFYMPFSFVKDRNPLIASPATTFFSTPVVTSRDIHIAGDRPFDNPDELLVAGLVADRETHAWAERLASGGFKYVILGREGDSTRYATLDEQPGLTLVGDYEDLILYRNTLWKPS